MRDERLRQVETTQEGDAEVAENGLPPSGEDPAVRPDPDRRVAELARALAATQERESDFRQAAFDLNAELLQRDDELARLRDRVDAAEGEVAELAALRGRIAELEQLMQTRAVRAATFWWRLKARIFRR
jgi:chromosome segregation ATPase